MKTVTPVAEKNLPEKIRCLECDLSGFHHLSIIGSMGAAGNWGMAIDMNFPFRASLPSPFWASHRQGSMRKNTSGIKGDS